MYSVITLVQINNISIVYTFYFNDVKNSLSTCETEMLSIVIIYTTL